MTKDCNDCGKDCNKGCNGDCKAPCADLGEFLGFMTRDFPMMLQVAVETHAVMAERLEGTVGKAGPGEELTVLSVMGAVWALACTGPSQDPEEARGHVRTFCTATEMMLGIVGGIGKEGEE